MKRWPLVLLLCAVATWPARGLEKWIYTPTNLLVDKNVDNLEALWRRAAAAGYTHVLIKDSKFARLGEMDARYFKNVERVKKLATELKLELVPALFNVGYSNDTLWHDPNLVEALPVKTVPLVVEKGVARVNSEPVALRNGDFSDLKQWSWKDDNMVAEDGAVRVTDPNGANARIAQRLKLQPFRQYHVSVRIKTREFEGKPEVKAIPVSGKIGVLNWDDLKVKSTQDWNTHHVVFNSLENNEITLIFGAWGGKSGSLWWDDARIEEVAFLNLTRRPGTPLIVTRENGRALEEGHDFQELRDPLLGKKPWPGSYDVYHQPPLLATNLPDGTRLLASYFHAVTIYDGQAMICPSEPRTLELLRDEARRLHAAFGAQGYMMSHDEIRVLNWDEACRRRGLTPGEILADNVKQCIAILAELNPQGRIYVWSDMFDPSHNAVKEKYYLVNGDLTGSWEGLEKEVIILPWNFSKRAESLKFFAARGHRQVIAGYYDSKPERIADWLAAAKGIKDSVIGVMYTTWQNKYGDLEKFAELTEAAAH